MSILPFSKSTGKAEPSKNKNAGKPVSKVSVQQSIPYDYSYVNGIIEISAKTFSKTYKLRDANFDQLNDEEQERVFAKFCDLLNMFSEDKVEITCVNRVISERAFKESHCLPAKNEPADVFRNEFNDLILETYRENNGIVTDKYITVTTKAENIEEATEKFRRLDETIAKAVSVIGGSAATPLTLEERMSLLHERYNPYENEPFVFDLAAMKNRGVTTKDIIAPASMKFRNNNMLLGETPVCVMFLDNYPSVLTPVLMADLTSQPICMTVSSHMRSLPQDKAAKLIRNQITNVDADILSRQKRATAKGYNPNLISPELTETRDEAAELLEQIQGNNQRLFFTTVVVAVYGKDEEHLRSGVEAVRTVGRKHNCVFKKLDYQQEAGFNASLPLGGNTLKAERLLTTETAAMFQPLREMNIDMANGIYFGKNPVSQTITMFDRMKNKNANAIILGTSGSGKSMLAKSIILQTFLRFPDDNIIIIDPSDEYTALLDSVGGEVIHISANSKQCLSPLDFDLRNTDSEEINRCAAKSEAMIAFCEAIMGSRHGLDPISRSIIDRCVNKVYEEYIKYLEENRITYDREKCPTLADFYRVMETMSEVEAQRLARALETYAVGNYNLFAHHTNVDSNARLLAYDIKNMEDSLKGLGFQVCLSTIMMRVMRSFDEGKRTWIFIDEAHQMTSFPAAASMLKTMFKQFRKWNGVPTAITQNVSDFIATSDAMALLTNCDTVIILNQSTADSNILKDVFHHDDDIQEYYTNVNPGTGLIISLGTCAPFEFFIPKENAKGEPLKIHEIFTTNPEDAKSKDGKVK